MNALRILGTALALLTLVVAGTAMADDKSASGAPAVTTAPSTDAAQAKPEGPTPLAIGAAAPMRDSKMKNVDGREVSLADAAGKKGTLVVFMCNHCPWVKAWQGRIAKVGNAALGRGVGVIAVNANDPAAYP